MSVDYHAILPELILAGTIMVVLVVDLFLPARLKWALDADRAPGRPGIARRRPHAPRGRTRHLRWRVRRRQLRASCSRSSSSSAAVIVLAVSRRYFDQPGYYQGEYYFLLLTSFLGCLLMPSSRDLLMLFISLELVSAPGFLMAAFRKWDVTGVEGGLKFFLIGVLSTAVMLFGMSLIYGLTGGETRLDAIASALAPARPLAGGDRARIDPVHRGRLRVQGLRVPVPVLGTRHVRGRAGPGRGVPGGGVQGGRLRRVAAADVRGVHRSARVLGADLRVPLDRHDDDREPRGAAAAAVRPAARVLGDRPGRLHAAAVRAGDERPGREPAGVRLRDRVHPDLRHHEPGRVRGGGGAQQAQSEAPDLRFRGGRPDRARSSRWGWRCSWCRWRACLRPPGSGRRS